METVNLSKSAPSAYALVSELDRRITEDLSKAGVSEGFSHLLRLRVSQINRCGYCIRLHARDALRHGESLDRVALLVAWGETSLFTERERVAIQLVESITLVNSGHIPNDTLRKAAPILNVEEISAVGWLAILMNSWNRIAIASRYPVTSTN